MAPYDAAVSRVLQTIGGVSDATVSGGSYSGVILINEIRANVTIGIFWICVVVCRLGSYLRRFVCDLSYPF